MKDYSASVEAAKRVVSYLEEHGVCIYADGNADVGQVCRDFLELAEPRQLIADLAAENARYEAALKSIAGNSCCEGCLEAKKVAISALIE